MTRKVSHVFTLIPIAVDIVSDPLKRISSVIIGVQTASAFIDPLQTVLVGVPPGHIAADTLVHGR